MKIILLTYGFHVTNKNKLFTHEKINNYPDDY